ncbi:IscS subfamily cysteine desulfurase [Candidatus Contendibacter odensensis]|uniref:cysteine desulfurase n=1 Tax=Candidatus Contendobacter odensis Run_B_J11 TaxID=1400861 RepID=A0A7U7J3N7_9GAMM|nr:IscS subfamily cysteine desulfurase [Candidatus Contendobacter odensis]CDH44370.1 cysteine desulfurase (tRNA sulfurtransferase), PLP-dependent [Candidatus Contendobacter odensis Run_B_J11]
MDLPIYLDYAATTPVDPQVAHLLIQHLSRGGVFGNPSSATHPFGQAAARAVEAARVRVATLLNADPHEIIWTSGATEANNLALQGALRICAHQGRHLITSKTEHKAVLDVCRRLERDGCVIAYLDPDPNGLIPPDRVAAALRPDTVLVSLMHVNNETGVVQDIATIGQITRQRGILLHVDAAQSAGKLPLDLQTLPVDLLSLSAHKLYGPKGIGALYVRQRPHRVRLEPLLYGGGQERGLRAGTLPTHQIVAMGKACRIASENMAVEQARIRALRDRLWYALAALGDVLLNGHPDDNVAGILNLSFTGIAAEALLTAIPEIAVSTGSACTSAGNEPSHVLRAMGCDAVRARGAVRFSLGRFTTAEEIEYTAQRVSAAIHRLRKLSPLWELRQRGLDQRVVDWAAVP